MSRRIHNVHFYNPKPRAIHHMTLNGKKEKLALARNDASIEIWNVTKAPFIEKLIPHDITNNSIEGLVWCEERLFSISLEGFLVEYDLRALTYKNKYSVTGQSAYCVDVNKTNTQLSIGTEQGYINVFSVGDEVLFEKFLDKQEGKIICLKYHPNAEFVVSGSLDFIRIWNVSTGHAIHKMTTGRASAKKPTIVWCVNVTNDFTIISGDSRGKLTFWDGNSGSQIESFQSHRADILAMCLSDDQRELHCAGVDANIASYSQINLKDNMFKWVKNVQRQLQDHDVKSLVHNGMHLISGGIDGYLFFTSLSKRLINKYSPILPSIADIARHSRLMMFKYPRHLEVWRLGEVNKCQEGLLETEPIRLLVITTDTKYDSYEGRDGILCSAITDDGNWIAYSTQSKISLLNFGFDLTNSAAKVTRKWNALKECALAMAFTPFSKQLIMTKQSGEINVLNFANEDVEIVQTLKANFKETIKWILVSPCGAYLIISDARNIVIWNLVNSEWKSYVKLPKYDGFLTALAVQPKSLYLIAAYNDNKLIEYDLREKCLTDFSKKITNQIIKFDEKETIRNILFDPHESNKIVLHVGSKIVVLNKDKANTKKSIKMRKLNEDLSQTNDNLNFKQQKVVNKEIVHRTIAKYDVLAFLGNLSLDEYVAVEVPHIKLIEQLPPCLKQYKFGTK